MASAVVVLVVVYICCVISLRISKNVRSCAAIAVRVSCVAYVWRSIDACIRASSFFVALSAVRVFGSVLICCSISVFTVIFRVSVLRFLYFSERSSF